jgi:hypothetical protein
LPPLLLLLLLQGRGVPPVSQRPRQGLQPRPHLTCLTSYCCCCCCCRAEVYHQFHNGLGKVFSPAYTRDLKQAVLSSGKIGPTGCLEVPF